MRDPWLDMPYFPGDVFHLKATGHGVVQEVMSDSGMIRVSTSLHGVYSTVSSRSVRKNDLGPWRDTCSRCAPTSSCVSPPAASS